MVLWVNALQVSPMTVRLRRAAHCIFDPKRPATHLREHSSAPQNSRAVRPRRISGPQLAAAIAEASLLRCPPIRYRAACSPLADACRSVTFYRGTG